MTIRSTFASIKDREPTHADKSNSEVSPAYSYGDAAELAQPAPQARAD